MTHVAGSSLADALRDRYTLERELGRGGMATVYLARDLKHKRNVALKVLDPELGVLVGAERFLREIETAAQLQHPHILPVFDSGEAAGQLWYTMPFVEGESLRDRLRREGRLAVAEAVRLAQEIAGALQVAHDRGIIHRDIKPENVLLSHGHALVADFGIARAPAAERGGSLTQTGLSLGTPAYMAPEQALGERNLDGRADQYALGCLLYELLSGQTPYAGSSAHALIAKHLADPTPDVRALRVEVPSAIAAAVQRAMAKSADQRFASADAFATALSSTGPVSGSAAAATLTGGSRPRRRWPLVAGTLVLLVILLTAVWFKHRAPPAEGSRVVAVLPFENQGKPEDDYLADGLADEVRGKLTQIPGIEVIARASSGQYKKTAKSPEQIARELGARYLLTGTVRWDRGDSASSRVRVSPELTEVVGAAARSRWGAPFDAAMTNVFQVQADIAERVARALDVQLSQATRQQLQAKPTQNLAAYDAYLQGLGDPSLGEPELQTPQQLQQSIAAFERAITLDSSFALAWAALAKTRRIYAQRATRPDFLARAKDAADRALALDSMSAVVHLAASRVYGAVDDSLRSAQELEAALRLGPNDPDVIPQAALHQYTSDRAHPERALALLRRAEALNPRSADIAQTLVAIYMDSYQFAAAVRAADHLATIAPRSSGAAAILPGVMRLLAGDTAGARRMLQAPPPEIPTADFLTSAAGFYWLLSDEQQRQLRGLSPEAFGSRIDWAFAQCRLARWRGDSAAAHAFADSLRRASEELRRVSPPDFQLTQSYAAALSWLGRQSEAAAVVREYREHPGPGGQPGNSDLGALYTDVGPIDSAARYFAAAIGNREQPGVVGMIPSAPHYAALRAYGPFRPYLDRLIVAGRSEP